MAIITQTRLKKLLHYNPVTGEFTNKINRHNARIGNLAGHINKSGYRVIVLNGKHYLAARLAYMYMQGAWPTNLVNRINHIKDDDSWSNLRDVNQREISTNKRKAKNNTSGHTGVCFHTKTRKWRAQIKVNGRAITLGDYTTYEEAVAVREHAEHEYGFHANHGEAA